MSLSFRHLDVEGEVVSRLFQVVKEGRNLSIYIQQDGQEIDLFRDRGLVLSTRQAHLASGFCYT